MLYKPSFLISFFFLVFALFSSCGKHDNPVPVTGINYKVLDIENNPRYENLRTIGGSAILETGVVCTGFNCNGVAIYRQKNDGAVDDFKAYDRTCTYEANACAMEIDKNWPYVLVCPCCGSEFNMEGGYMEKGPAKYPLREFNCDFYNGDLRLY
ncbi:MAG: Rieske 2Fe-2S domain-containing protein [Bacteroidales bacterium]|nr:Rieske 2Fe-2S domain-containing protein [Bacteroidales bacterium]